MGKKGTHFIMGVSVLMSLGLAACSGANSSPAEVAPKASDPVSPAFAVTATIQSFTDPFAYCASVGTIDKPDARYNGPMNSDEIVKGYLKAAGLDANASYPDAFKQMTIWRCMNNKVYACNFGANLPCDSKADTNRNPTQAMVDFCKENPGSDFIPMAVTGHATIYSFHCVEDQPELLDQIAQVDAAGYLANIWYPIEAVP